ncbi:MAG: hypothetical protein ACRCTI_10025 [Beijerinckiaceae bacterium]
MSSWQNLVPVKRRNPGLLYSQDLGDRKEVAVEICDITPGSMKTEDGDMQTGLVSFWDAKTGKPREKRLALNATNRDALFHLFGPNFWEAVGWIVIRRDVTEITDRKLKRRVKKECLRINLSRPKPDKYKPSFDYAKNVEERTAVAVKKGWTTGRKIEPIETVDVTDDESGDVDDDLTDRIAEEMQRASGSSDPGFIVEPEESQ